MMNVTSPRRVGHRVVRRAARPPSTLRLPVPLAAPATARPPTLWQRLRQWLWPRLTPEQRYARFLRFSSGALPEVVSIGGHPFLLTGNTPAHVRARRAQSDLP